MLILEGFLVGFYVLLLFFVFRLIIKTDLYLELFIIGFIKHLFSYYIGLQSQYCKIYLNKNNNYKVKSSNIIIECLLEGLAFIYFGYLLKLILNPNNYSFAFILGFIIHIIADFYGIHKLFLINNCHLKINNI